MYNQIDSNKRKTWLLMTIFLIVIVLLGWVFGEAYDLGYGGLVIALMIAVLMNLFSYFKGDKVALAISGAHPIQKENNPYIYRLVENLTIASGLPLPKIHVINDPNINAFACGRDPRHASIAITTGAAEKLENEELEGVIAHELSHIKNYDIRLMTIVIVCVGVVTLMADFFLRANFMFGGKRDRNSGNLGAILMIAGLVLAILSPVFATLIQLAVSRKREYLADASSSLLTRYPEGLARALEKIRDFNQPMKRANHATAHLYIASPFSGVGKKMAGLFATHPPIDERIAKLRGMA
ncbi:MAG: zinc metalloprotease HtpX [Candidatus Komeilibacteria bacterium RIFCSPLOWO2_01_FULL_45_10]|uniref:Protease HtpX homolog n=1 Tax=Candidatus Komeilibacteria bacterium RIFCSPLOWO2_01_FULL_45_10 TaxID=1798550 RepID=A0A1G2BHL6_9BACT|nr:MAG: zinc metalloprotease HtpX [Candidatus Komeilibacteria bacterium RIFCSPLOWO2_01_FULL_45_10]